MHYTPLTFTIPELTGISTETITEHIKLYEGYVKHVNLIAEKLATYRALPQDHGYAAAELQRRLGFEFGGMRNHEYYFAQFEGGSTTLPADSRLATLIDRTWGGLDFCIQALSLMAMTRGVGWVMLYHDPHTDQLITTWVDEQHLGQLPDLDLVLALDMWEHSYMRDYVPSQKAQYVEAFFKNINWEVVAGRLV